MKKTFIVLALLQAAATFFPIYTKAETLGPYGPEVSAVSPADTSAGVWNESLSGSVVTGTRNITDVRHLPFTVTSRAFSLHPEESSAMGSPTGPPVAFP